MGIRTTIIATLSIAYVATPALAAPSGPPSHDFGDVKGVIVALNDFGKGGFNSHHGPPNPFPGRGYGHDHDHDHGGDHDHHPPCSGE